MHDSICSDLHMSKKVCMFSLHMNIAFKCVNAVLLISTKAIWVMAAFKENLYFNKFECI